VRVSRALFSERDARAESPMQRSGYELRTSDHDRDVCDSDDRVVVASDQPPKNMSKMLP
jgi:hypothetical protein